MLWSLVWLPVMSEWSLHPVFPTLSPIQARLKMETVLPPKLLYINKGLHGAKSHMTTLSLTRKDFSHETNVIPATSVIDQYNTK
jgi:hypothetical protein